MRWRTDRFITPSLEKDTSHIAITRAGEEQALLFLAAPFNVPREELPDSIRVYGYNDDGACLFIWEDRTDEIFT